jgi:exosome complex component RRP46
LPILPALIQTSILALLSAAIPLTATLTSAVLAVVNDAGTSRVALHPTAREIEQSQSLHVFAFTSHNDLILAESEGEFTMKEWDTVLNTAQRQCCASSSSEDVDMTDNETLVGADLRNFTRSIMEAKIASDLYWK